MNLPDAIFTEKQQIIVVNSGVPVVNDINSDDAEGEIEYSL